MRASVALEDAPRIEYMEVGQGEPLVYLHAAGCALPKARFPHELGSTFRVLLPSRPGYDGSTGTCRSAREYAEVMAAFIRQVCGAPVHLVAESAGGSRCQTPTAPCCFGGNARRLFDFRMPATRRS
jgi:pimeloyl-ACP methyl ester carboxylesterase